MPGNNDAMSYRLRTLLIVLAIEPPVLAIILAFSDRPFIEFQRWLIRVQPGGQKTVLPPAPPAPMKAPGTS
jgi:hypothetical protein